jgi:hypothetical protein
MLNRDYRNMKAIFLFAVAMLVTVSCSCSAHSPIQRLEGRYVAVSSKHFTIELKQSADSLLGTHCFVGQDGNRIDCCEADDGYSMRFRTDSSGYYSGILTDCYQSENHVVRIIQNATGFRLIFTNRDHPFAPDSLSFIPERKRRSK